MILKAQLSKAPIPSRSQSSTISGEHASPARQSSLKSSSQAAPPVTPQQLVQQKQQAQQLSKPDSQAQPGAELSQFPSQQQVLSPAAQSAADADQVAQQQQHSGSASAEAHSHDLGQGQAGASRSSPIANLMQTDYLFHFGDTTEIRKALEMPNRLTGYAI